MIKKGDFGFKQMGAKFETLKKILPTILANEVENHFVEGFKKGGRQTDKSASGWRPRKSNRNNAGRGILVKNGDLRRDIQRRAVKWERTVVGTRNIPYAARHNDGLNMPQREFIGESKSLNRKLDLTIKKELDKIKP